MERISSRIRKLQDEIDKDYDRSESLRQPPSNQYYQDHGEELHGFGDTRDPVKIATDIEDNPMPPGICEVTIGGRPIDLHMFEDYMVWRISPYQMRTVLRYRTARMMEEIKNYSSSPKAKMKGNVIIMIMVALAFLIIGIMVLMFMPQLTALFKGFI